MTDRLLHDQSRSEPLSVAGATPADIDKWTAARVREALSGRWPDDRYLHVYEAPLHSDRQGGYMDVVVFALWHSLGHEIDAVEVKVSYSDWCKEWRRVEWRFTDHEGRIHRTHKQPTDRELAYYAGEDWRLEHHRYGYSRGEPPPDFWPTVERIESVNTTKSEAWRKRCHRFWVAAPAALAVKIALDVKDKPELEGWGVLGVDSSGTHAIVKAKRSEPSALSAQQWLGVLRAAADSGFQALNRAESRGYMRAVNEAKNAQMVAS